jgi:hypothetical protein
MRPYGLEKRVVLCAEQFLEKRAAVQIRTVRIFLMLLAASKFVPSFALKIVPPLCCSFLFRKWKLLSCSCSLSISQSLQERMTSHLAFFLL